MNEFNKIDCELMAWLYFIMMMLCGVAFSFLIFAVFYNKRDTYFYGQIDAIRGIIKYKLERNEDGEEVWFEIKD